MTKDAKKDVTWIEKVHAKRESLYSNVVVVETNDDQRFKQFTEYEDEVVRRKMMIWDTYQGLSIKENGKDESLDQGDNPLQVEPPQIKIGKTIEDDRDEAEKSITVIIKNILSLQDLPQKALNVWATHDSVFRHDHMVVVFTPSKDFIDARVLDKCILIQPPLSLASERVVELDKLCTRLRLADKITKDEMTQLVSLTGGLDLNQTQAVLIETLVDYMVAKKLDVGLVAKTKAEAINKSSVLRVEMTAKFGFEGVGGYEVVKKYVSDTLILPLKDPIRAKLLGVERPRGAIIFGPGGTGKTILAKACAKELSYPFVTLSPENFMSSLVGESERNLSKAIRIIEDMAPCLVFIDEIDRLGGRGESAENDGGTSRRLFSQMLEWLGDSDRQAVVIGATNMPYMDAAFRREGRFDVLIPMLSPDLEARIEILKIHLNTRRQVKHEISNACLNDIAKDTDCWKGNMLEELVKRAVRNAFVRNADVVTEGDLKDARADYRVNLEALRVDEDKYKDMAKKLTNSEKFLSKLFAEKRGDGGRDAVLKAKNLISPG
jgi:ATP-dependent 26S proteasome regulatory subunit